MSTAVVLGDQIRSESARRMYARVLRSFCCGEITNDQYQDLYGELGHLDPSIATMHHHVVWFMYDDLSTHRMRGIYRLNPEFRHLFARMVLFLRTDFPSSTTGPKTSTERGRLPLMQLLSLVTAGLFVAMFFEPGIGPIAAASLILTIVVACLSAGRHTHLNDDVWPFLNSADLEAAKSKPTYLCVS